MAEETFSDLGRVEAIAKLYEGTPYRPFQSSWFETSGKGYITTQSRTFIEGVDFDLVYFPLKHLGYKCVTAVTGELYAELSHPRTLDLRLGISSKLDFKHIREVWDGVVTAAREHGFKQVDLDLVPSPNGLVVSVSATGETSLLTAKRRPAAKSMDLICVSDNLGGAYMGFQILEKEKRAFEKSGDAKAQPDLENYRHLVGAYLKPSINPQTIKLLEDAEIIPSYGYLVSRGLADAVRRLVRDSGLGAKIYVNKLPFAGKTFDLGRELDIDPISAALNGGEDYRLLFTIPIGKHDKFRHDFQTFDIIGHLAKPEVGASVVTPDGVELPIKAQGWNNE
ncbi:MAG: thiamine-phosphate kinase [Bacteroidales bacterium]|nr:thiamine-phosphate kinase [Bacteroidales bacterium]